MEVHCQQRQPKPYRPRRPAQTVLYQVVQGHLETVLAAQGDSASAIPAHAERALRRYLECGILAHGFARARCGSARGGAVAFIHRFGSALNAHTHFHVCAIDGVFEPHGGGVRLHTALAPSPDDIEAVQTAIRQRTLRAFQRRGWLERSDRLEMEQWRHGGGFSLDASVDISGGDRRGRERLLRYCARPPFAGERLEWIDAGRVR